MHSWSYDIAAAPRGQQDGRTFKPDWLWIACKGGEVLRSYWIPAKGRDGARWLNLNKGSEPVAWMLFMTPEHPFGDRDDARADIAAIMSSEHLPMINDVGGI